MSILTAFIAKKAIPWRTVFICLLVLAVSGSIFAGYMYVNGLTEKIANERAKNAQLVIQRDIANELAREINKQHNDSVERLQRLEEDRSNIEAINIELLEEINRLLAKDELDEKDAADFNAFNSRLNGLLNNRSRGQ